MKLFEKLILFLTYPILWFWENQQKYKESGEFSKLILLFLLSLISVLLLGLGCFLLFNYILTYHLNLLLICFGIAWVYIYVRNKSLTQHKEASELPCVENVSEEQAEKGYPIMRNIIFQTSKIIASDIGVKTPRLLQEIELPEGHYVMNNSICFYQFRLFKENFKMQYSKNDLVEFKHIFQTALAYKLQSGDFPNIKMENYRDAFGNWYDSIIIDTIEDIGDFLIVHAVFCSPDYSNYIRSLSENMNCNNSTSLETHWETTLK